MIPDWPAERRDMVARQLQARDIRDPRVLAAMGEIRREEFLPLDVRVLSYRDEPAPIGYGQTISQPYMTAFMAQVLGLEGTEKTLDVGAGSGYHAAVLARLARTVWSIEIVPALVERARRNLARAGGSANVHVVKGDGSLGFVEEAPYQAISVGAGAPDVPPALIDQLDDPGVLVIPVGPLKDQSLLVITKRRGRVRRKTVAHCRFVPLRGGEGWQ
ncbi:MAG: protein-L-isoaspartate(D-aspartate) O-methyltransferase [Bryobacteraceae bacterium]